MKNKYLTPILRFQRPRILRMISIARFYVPVVFANFIASFIYPISAPNIKVP